eukprot:tig00021357_g20755.t1
MSYDEEESGGFSCVASVWKRCFGIEAPSSAAESDVFNAKQAVKSAIDSRALAISRWKATEAEFTRSWSGNPGAPGILYRIAVATDGETFKGKERVPTLRFFDLFREDASGKYSVVYIGEYEVGNLGAKNKALELVELVIWNGQLLSVDNKTSMLVEIQGPNAIPRVNLGSDSTGRPFKARWMTIKENLLYIGGEGRTDHPDTCQVKRVTPDFQVETIDFFEEYRKMQIACGCMNGFLGHKAVFFHPLRRKWMMFPRRVSGEVCSPALETFRGANVYLMANHDLNGKFDTKRLPIMDDPARGFVTVKALPGHENEYIVIRTTDFGPSDSCTYAAVVTLEGKTLMPETYLDDRKCEGLEIIEQHKIQKLRPGTPLNLAPPATLKSKHGQSFTASSAAIYQSGAPSTRALFVELEALRANVDAMQRDVCAARFRQITFEEALRTGRDTYGYSGAQYKDPVIYNSGFTPSRPSNPGGYAGSPSVTKPIGSGVYDPTPTYGGQPSIYHSASFNSNNPYGNGIPIPVQQPLYSSVQPIRTSQVQMSSPPPRSSSRAAGAIRF